MFHLPLNPIRERVLVVVYEEEALFLPRQWHTPTILLDVSMFDSAVAAAEHSLKVWRMNRLGDLENTEAINVAQCFVDSRVINSFGAHRLKS